jgi:uncharacterized protein (TIGR00725 family)
VTVVGAEEASALEEQAASTVGAFVARIGAVLVTGGRGGVMAAASRACREAGGRVVGVLPGMPDSRGNPWLDVRIVTGMGSGRNVINVLSGDLVVAVGGGFGTLSEIALALKHEIPVVGIGSWQLSRPGQAVTGYYPYVDVEAALARVRELLVLPAVW